MGTTLEPIGGLKQALSIDQQLKQIAASLTGVPSQFEEAQRVVERMSRGVPSQLEEAQRVIERMSRGAFRGFSLPIPRARIVVDDDIASLRSKLEELSKELQDTTANAEAKAKTGHEWQSTAEELNRKRVLGHVIDRVSEEASEKLLSGDGYLREQFESEEPVACFVVSLDIRRSTNLMLKARDAKRFAQFISDLCDYLRKIILANMGVFDKFTGDGILAFFPVFYSGSDAAYRAVRAATMCHKAFEDHYHRNRSCFTTVIRDTGLGIGIDYGPVQLVQVGGQLTVVGPPVVYACRLPSSCCRNQKCDGLGLWDGFGIGKNKRIVILLKTPLFKEDNDAIESRSDS